MVAVLLAAVLAPLIVGAALVIADNIAGVGQRTSAAIALSASVVSAACVGIAVIERPVLDQDWVPALGLRLHLGIDGISAPLLVLTAGIGVLTVLHGIARPPATAVTGRRERHGTFLGSLLLVIGAAIATFLAQDAILFFAAFELVLIPMWMLIKGFGDPHTRVEAASRFVLYTVLGSTLMLVGILAMTYAVGSSDLATLAAQGPATLSTSQQVLIAALLLVGLGIKVPVFPLHSWLPSAHTSAPTAGSILLAAVLLKLGTYGVVRLVAGPVSDGLAQLSPVVGVIAVVGILWGGLVCLAEPSLKRLVAWSSVAHMGFVVLALSTGTVTGVQAALYGNLAHGVVSALLFVVAGGLKERWGNDDVTMPRPALRETSPRLGFALVVGMAGSLALPGLAAFWGEVLAVFSAWTPGAYRPELLFRILTILAALGGVLASAYALRVLRLVHFTGGGSDDKSEGADDFHGAEWVVAAVLIVAVVGLGLAPSAILPISEADVIQLLGVSR
ncbi:complex I subunit 4 family protein [Demetria terragena]|uniref:complex I subunit 4 family protein n=1 Tax=Demetria terragena TaxID=63959 RepID=UPI0003749614|nr:NADH-quinone oxidoreductase subunit M [Demetria terragena]